MDTGGEVYPLVLTPSSRPGRAFPSAEGFGSKAIGGRRGQVVYVTSLADYDPDAGEPPIRGTLRWALEQMQGPRIVVFGVGGTIWLKKNLWLSGASGSYVTIAGQTAPGDGIQLAGFWLAIAYGAHDVIVRHLRIRAGVSPFDPWMTRDAQDNPVWPPYLKWEPDSMVIYGAGGALTYNVIIDHCSIEWAVDENGNPWDNTAQITFQYCIFGAGSTFGHGSKIGEPGVTYPYNHSCGFVTGGEYSTNRDDYLTVHHCLFIGNNQRNPLLAHNGGLVDLVNNVIYNWGDLGTQVMRGVDSQGRSLQYTPRVNIVGNWYQAGPNSNCCESGRPRRAVWVAQDVDDHSLYVEDNWLVKGTQVISSGWDLTWTWDEPASANISKQRSSRWPVPADFAVTAEPASGLVDSLRGRVGANLPRLDPVDRQLIADLMNGTGGIGFGSWDNYQTHPSLAGGPAPPDADGDGMPDEWELAQGLDPDDPADGSLDPDGDGYTNVEEYLNDLAGER